MSDCCHTEKEVETGVKRRRDWLLRVSSFFILLGLFWPFAGQDWQAADIFSASVIEFISRMWWGVALGIVAVGLLQKLDRRFLFAALGKPGTKRGVLQSTFAGVLLDVCNHGITIIGLNLYRRGASMGQTAAFLLASPWNSISYTIILASLIGWGWTFAFIGASALVGMVTGWVLDALVKMGWLPANPQHGEVGQDGDFRFGDEAKRQWRAARFGKNFWKDVGLHGFSESRMILRWVAFGVVLTAGVRALVPEETFHAMFGPDHLGLLATLGVATVLEVCSEGAAPLAADLLQRAAAPGNAFLFLMAGIVTDYTEIMALREVTKSWKLTFALPLVALPMVLVIAWLMNGWTPF